MLLRPTDALPWSHTIPMGLESRATIGLFDGVIFGIQAAGKLWLNQTLLCLCLLVKLADADLDMYRTCVTYKGRNEKNKVSMMKKGGKKKKQVASAFDHK